MAEAEVVTDETEYLKGWTVQSETSPLPPAAETPAQIHTSQLPDAEAMEESGLVIPENQITDDVEMLDPADRVRVGGDPLASTPGGVVAYPEGTHIPGDSAADAGGPPASASDGPSAVDEGAPPDTWSKQEIQDWADERSIEGVDMDSQTKAEMIAAIEAAVG